MTQANEERLLELLADQATIGLGREDEAELQTLLTQFPDWHPDSMHLAAAATDLALGVPAEPMPAALREAIAADAATFFAKTSAAAEVSTQAAVAAKAEPSPSGADVVVLEERLKRARTTSTLGWLAAVACLVVAFIGWNQQGQASPDGTDQPDQPVQMDPAQARAELIASASDYTQWDWNATEDPTAAGGVSGDVVWSPSRQQGFMRIKGLQPSKDDSFVYQLWVFDKTRNQEHPVDGGVFNLDSDGEIVVPIDAKLPVGEVGLFAVTVEPPGGVVVSSRERIALTAAPPAG